MNWQLRVTLALEEQLHSSKTGKASEAPAEKTSVTSWKEANPLGEVKPPAGHRNGFQQQAVCYVGTAFYQTASKQDTCVQASC